MAVALWFYGITSTSIAGAQAARGGPTVESLSSLPLNALMDQFGRSIDMAALRGRAVILLVADKDGSDGLRSWFMALRAAAPSTVVVLAAADLEGAPRFLRGIIKSGFPKDTSAGVLLDWTGTVARRVRGERDHLVGLVFAADGGVRERLVLPMSGVSNEVRARLLGAGAP